jgi:hypothetical protein
MDNVRRRNFDAAGSMFRKPLDTALRVIDLAEKMFLPHG